MITYILPKLSSQSIFYFQGNQIEKKPLPEKASIFSSDMPNTTSGNNGSRVATNLGRQMHNLEFKLYAEKPRRKLGIDLVCY